MASRGRFRAINWIQHENDKIEEREKCFAAKLFERRSLQVSIESEIVAISSDDNPARHQACLSTKCAQMSGRKEEGEEEVYDEWWLVKKAIAQHSANLFGSDRSGLVWCKLKSAISKPSLNV